MLHYILRGIFLSCSFTLITFTANTQLPNIDTIAYNKLVFPSDVNQYPLLFVFEGYDLNNVRYKYKQKAEKEIYKFITADSKSRGFQHELISANEVNSYPDSIYRYIVKVTSMRQLHREGYERMMISFRFDDRQNPDHYYYKYGRCDTYPAPYYSEDDINGIVSKHFFKDLNRIILMLDSGKSTEETFKNEIEIQSKKIKQERFLGVGIGSTLVLGCVIFGIIASS